MSAGCSDPASFAFCTPRLAARAYAPADLDAHRRLRADPEVARFMHWSDAPDDFAQRLAAAAVPGAPIEGGGWVNFAVTRLADGAVIGDHGVNLDRRTAWLGLALAPETRRQGLGRELLGASMRWLEARGVRSFRAEIDFGNAASFALFFALGFAVIEEAEDDFGPFCVLAGPTG
jgi:RimJ/RimL family protein N-acetyltransferase